MAVIKGIDIEGLTDTFRALDTFEAKVRKEVLFESVQKAMTPYASVVKQAAITKLTTLNSQARRKMASAVGIKFQNKGKGRKGRAIAIVGPVVGREFTSPRKRRAGKNGQFDYANMAAWFGGGGVAPHKTGSKGGTHPGIPETNVWSEVFRDNAPSIVSRFSSSLTTGIQKAVKQSAAKSAKRIASQQRAFDKATGGG
jgi:hypothetical protein